MERKDLYQRLTEYSFSDYYAFHMPGHKRQLGNFKNPFSIDITEIEGFDDLHHPQKNGILVEAQKEAAKLYGSSETHFLVNGSTAGILSAISGCTKKGGKILVARNSHRSVYHGIGLQGLETVYLYPQQEGKLGINGSILPEDVEKVLDEQENIQAVFLTSPTYDGICSDIEKIGKIVHKKKIPLLVDQAHGAHFPFHSFFPEDAVKQGADVVIHSVHKTLPSLTQTALLHINGSLVDRERIRMYLSVYQTSSPSYVLMASIDSCMKFLETQGGEAFAHQIKLLKEFYRDCKDLKHIQVMDEQVRDGKTVFDVDLSKLLCSVRHTPWSGKYLAERLLQEYHIQMEMGTAAYALGISSVGDTEEGFNRLRKGLFELDNQLEKKCGIQCPQELSHDRQFSQQLSGDPVFPKPQIDVPIWMALDQAKEEIEISSSLGRTAGGFVYLYPPGIPLLAPGEIISDQILECLSYWRDNHMEIQGLTGNQKILVLQKDCRK